MISNIVLHIGVHKTASTTIQNTLHKEREKLAGIGILYPHFFAGKTLFINHSVPFYSLFSDHPDQYHVNIAHGYTSDEDIRAVHQEYLNQFRMQTASFQGDTMIISGEDILHLNAKQLSKLKELLTEVTQPEVSIKVVVICRHPVSRFRSAVQASVCNFGMGLDEATDYHLSVRKINYQMLVGTFAEVFGRENITVLKYEDILDHVYGPSGALLELINSSIPEKIRPDVVRANAGYTGEAVMLCDAINRTWPDMPDYTLHPERMISIVEIIKEMPGARFFLPAGTSKKVWNSLSEDIHWLTGEFSLTPYRERNEDIQSRTEIWSRSTMDFLAENIGLFPRSYRGAIQKRLLHIAVFDPVISISTRIRLAGFLLFKNRGFTR